MVKTSDPLLIRPFTRPLRGTVMLPGSKSITNRALLLAALAESPVTLEGALFSRDTRILCAALEGVGIKVRADEENRRITVEGMAGRIPVSRAKISVGNAGTAARFLPAFLALHPDGVFEFDGDAEMYRRPMAGLLDALAAMGAQFDFGGRSGHYPFRMRTSGLTGGEFSVDARASSQILSALLLVSPFCADDMRIRSDGVRTAFVDITIRMMKHFGQSVERSEDDAWTVSVDGRGYHAPHQRYAVEPDVTAASYFLALTRLVGGELWLQAMPEDPLQGDAAFLSVMEDFGVEVSREAGGWQVRSGRWKSGRPTYDFRLMSDTFLTLAAMVPALSAPLTIEGIAHTRLQETDRVEGMRTELLRLGQKVKAGEGYLRMIPVHPRGVPVSTEHPPVIRTYQDHRFAMSFAVLGSWDAFADGRSWLQVADPACCGKTYPGFFDVMGKLYEETHESER